MGEMNSALLVAQGLGTLAGSYSKSQSIRAQGSFAQSQSNLNARMAQLQAQDATLRADREAGLQSYRTKRLLGAQRAALAAQGVDVGAGSALMAKEETAAMGALDAETIRRNGIMESLGFQMQAASDVTQGRMSRLASRNAARSTILTGGLTAARELGRAKYAYDRAPRVPNELSLDDDESYWERVEP